MKEAIDRLRSRLREIDDLASAASILHWDQTTYMPARGAEARGRQLATLNRLAHEKFIDKEIGKLLDSLAGFEQSLPADSDDASLIRVARRDYEKAVRVPAEFLAEAHEHFAAAYQAWTRARPDNDFKAVEPMLERSLDLSRRYSGFFPDQESLADPLIDRSDPGMKADAVSKLFADLRQRLVPLVQQIGEQPLKDDSFLFVKYDEAAQLRFGEAVIRRFGFDFERGRQDKTHHPFMTKFSLGDVRITTRVQEDFLGEALFSTLHEAGHALYEMGIDPSLEGTLLADGTSSGVHESQSRLWENVVGRSRGFWEHYYPLLQEQFPDPLASIPPERFYEAINKVERSLIRTDADEVTYNLHVMMRFEFENDLLEGRLEVADLPEAWRNRMERDLGLAPDDHRDGVLQDVHWFSGFVGGAFQGYTLGNILSAQFYAAAVARHPEIPEEIRTGRFETLHAWLRENLYRHGKKFTPEELVSRVTGGSIRIEPYIDYLTNKYGEIYSLP